MGSCALIKPFHDNSRKISWDANALFFSYKKTTKREICYHVENYELTYWKWLDYWILFGIKSNQYTCKFLIEHTWTCGKNIRFCKTTKWKESWSCCRGQKKRKKKEPSNPKWYRIDIWIYTMLYHLFTFGLLNKWTLYNHYLGVIWGNILLWFFIRLISRRNGSSTSSNKFSVTIDIKSHRSADERTVSMVTPFICVPIMPGIHEIWTMHDRIPNLPNLWHRLYNFIVT